MKNNNKKRLLLLSVTLCVLLLAFAREDAGRIDKRFDKPPEFKSTNKLIMFPLQEQLPPAQAGNIKFILKELRLTGNSAFSNQQQAERYRASLGKEISLLNLYKIRDTITQKHADAGIGLSKAIVPHQQIQTDRVDYAFYD